ncbi:MAG TPA: hypothetical protein VF145_09505 [Chitinophagaceae bacterium]
MHLCIIGGNKTNNKDKPADSQLFATNSESFSGVTDSRICAHFPLILRIGCEVKPGKQDGSQRYSAAAAAAASQAFANWLPMTSQVLLTKPGTGGGLLLAWNLNQYDQMQFYVKGK